MHTPDWLPVSLALLILAGRFAWVLARSDESKQSIDLRRAWVKRIFAAPGAEILAVQTVRNSIMAASLMATTAVLALMGVLSIGHSQMNAPEAPIGWIQGGTNVKLFLPLALLAACVVLFSKAVRLYHRTGYSLGLSRSPLSASELSDIAETAATNELTRAAQLYRSGWRTFYAAIATGAWLLGGWMMLTTTIIIIAVDIAARIE
jgi:uncharacterized membrane protein